MKKILFSLTLLFCIIMHAQEKKAEKPPYHEIPKYPEAYTSGSIISRMIDGLGYRYYWATEGLMEKDLSYRPSEDARTARETLEHIYGLSETVVNAPQRLPNIRPADWSQIAFEELRNKTLMNLKKASELFLTMNDADISTLEVVFKRGEKEFKSPYWNMLNGPLEDAVYHTGQIASFRRSSGNPMNPKVNVFLGKTRE